MTDARRVVFDTRSAVTIQALMDTVGMSRPQQAAYWLEKIAAALHRGPRIDTWTSARDRAAKFAGIDRSMAKRIWQRWNDMKGVDGDALIKLMIAYQAIYHSEAADGYQESVERSERMAKVIAALDEVEGNAAAERRRARLGGVGLPGVA